MWRALLLAAIALAVSGCSDDAVTPANFSGTPSATATLTATAAPSPTTAPLHCDLDRFDGCRAISSRATGHFRTEQIDGVWWLITPEGNAFFSAGVNHVDPEGDYAPALGCAPYHDNIIARYGTEAAWADVVVNRFDTLGFTTVGAWSKYELFAGRVPYTIILGFAGYAPPVAGVAAGLTGLPVRDYFAPEFAAGAAAEA